jgi:hypothetical protein
MALSSPLGPTSTYSRCVRLPLRVYVLIIHAAQGSSYRPPSAKWLARCLQENFINSYENLRNGRLCVNQRICGNDRPVGLTLFATTMFISWTLVTSSFSHAEPGHALFNGLTFWFLAPTALTVLGNTQFLMLYVGSEFSPPAFSPSLRKRF